MIRTVAYYRKIVSSIALSNESAFPPCGFEPDAASIFSPSDE